MPPRRSNRRHLLARDMVENEQATAIQAGEAVDEKVSLADRFGLRLGFNAVDQDGYLDMVLGCADHYGIVGEPEELKQQALAWAMQRGGRSGRVAWQFLLSLPDFAQAAATVDEATRAPDEADRQVLNAKLPFN